MKIILAVDENWGIGKDNKLLFHLPKDLKHFKDTTLDSIVIMGRATYESMGGALPKRENIVLSRDKTYQAPNALIMNTKDEVLDYVSKTEKEAFVIGGSQIVEMFLDYCDEAIITKIRADGDADTYLHNFDTDPDFELIEESEVMNDNDIDFTYAIYRRKK